MVIPTELEAYIEQYTTEESPLLNQLNRETHLNVLQPNMLSGHYQGILLQMLSKAISPKAILEIGTYTGYSALCLAQGLQPGGKLHTIDINEEMQPIVNRYIAEAGQTDNIEFHIGDALEIIPSLEVTFDLVFIDADKENYGPYFDLVVEKVRPGGFILADNVLWKGKVLNEAKDNKTEVLHRFNQKVQADGRVKNCLLPVRDGLMLIERL